MSVLRRFIDHGNEILQTNFQDLDYFHKCDCLKSDFRLLGCNRKPDDWVSEVHHNSVTMVTDTSLGSQVMKGSKFLRSSSISDELHVSCCSYSL